MLYTDIALVGSVAVGIGVYALVPMNESISLEVVIIIAVVVAIITVAFWRYRSRRWKDCVILGLLMFIIIIGSYYTAGLIDSFTSKKQVKYIPQPVAQPASPVPPPPPSFKTCSRGEAECRRVLESIFSKPFPNTRPKWLVNPQTGHRLELDCYNKTLKLAVEYNGEQHYCYVPRFHKSEGELEYQKYRDEVKKRLCEKKGVELITVKYDIPHDKIESYIRSELEARGVLVLDD